MGRLSQFNLADRRALVTGSSRGIGFAIAGALAGAGADVILNARGTVALGEASEKLAASGARVRTLAFDVTSEGSVTEAIAFAESGIGPIDILVNNAGMQHRAPLEDFSTEEFEQVMTTNVTSAFIVGKAVAKGMIARRSGRIINICSLMSGLSRSSIAPYAASKAAIANLTRGMAVDWARHGLNINGIAPGYFKTELNAALIADAEFTAWVEKRTPMGRWGEVAELGGAAIFLASDAAASSTDTFSMSTAPSQPRSEPARIIIVMGVSSSGKSSVGKALGRRLHAPFLDGDGYHPPANKEKMRLGIPLTDADRWPWLEALAYAVRDAAKTTGSAVGACSALKRAYREYLSEKAGEPILFVFLEGDKDVIARRIASRSHEFMPASLLDSQFATLEVPAPDENVLKMSILDPVETIADKLAQELDHLKTFKRGQ